MKNNHILCKKPSPTRHICEFSSGDLQQSDQAGLIILPTYPIQGLTDQNEQIVSFNNQIIKYLLI